jgi:hypothetical protein
MIENSIKTKATPKTTLVFMLLQLFALETTKLSFIGVVRECFDVPLKLDFSLKGDGKVSALQKKPRSEIGQCTIKTAPKYFLHIHSGVLILS